MSALGISTRGRAVGVARKEKVHVGTTACDSLGDRVDVRNRLPGRATAFPILVVVILGPCWSPKSGADDQAGRCGCRSKKPPARDDAQRVVRSRPRKLANCYA